MGDIELNTGLLSHAALAVVVCFLLVLQLLSGVRSAIARWLAITYAITALWAALQTAAYAWDGPYWLIARNLEVLFEVAWVLFLGGLAKSTVPWLQSGLHQRLLQFLFGIAVMTIVVLTSITGMAPSDDLPDLLFRATVVGHISFAVCGLVLLENVFRRATKETMWGLKFLIFGCGAIFAYQFYIYSDALLLGHLSDPLFSARGAVTALAVPLIAVATVRMPSWSIDIHVSRDAVFHTTTVVACGIYLIAMSMAGYHIRSIGGEWGTLLQVSFLWAAILFLLLAMFSGAIRGRIRVFIAKHFFSYRYDYRYEWHRFIGTMSATDGRLHERAIVAVANIIDSPAGALWVQDRTGEVYEAAASWNYPSDMPNLPRGAPLLDYLRQEKGIFNLLETGSRERDDWPELPKWFADLPRPWLVIPCKHREQIFGFLVMSQPRAPQTLNWEEYDLLKTLGAQVASYLAEEAALHALVDVEQLERFNKRFAFVVHDIKNVVGQLSLMLSNAEKHGDNPDFQKDVFRTIQNTVTKMNNLLGQLKQTQVEQRRLTAVDVASVVRIATMAWQRDDGSFQLDLGDTLLLAVADKEKLNAVVSHVVQNAVDAAGEKGQVVVKLREADGHAVLDVIDNGPGMDPEFVRSQLFRPLRTTKGTGYGIGAYQTRELVREMGGALEVRSRPDEGTCVSIRLKMPEAPEDRQMVRFAREG